MTILLDVPFEKKDKAKERKYKWCNDKKMWYVKFKSSCGSKLK